MAIETLDPQQQDEVDDHASDDELEAIGNLPSAERPEPVSADDSNQQFAAPAAQEPVYERPGNQPDDMSAAKPAADGPSWYRPDADKQQNRNNLAASESKAGEPDAQKGSLYKLASQEFDNLKFWNLRGRLTRRRAIFGGGMIGTIIALIIFVTIGSGPFQFLQIFRLMEQFHLSHQENASNDRVGRLYRFARSGGHAGETRLGWLGSKLHTNIIGDLDKIGLKPVYGNLDIYQGFEIDRTNPKSPFYRFSDQQILEALQARGVDVSQVTFSKGKASVSVSGYLNKRRTLGFLSDQLGETNIPGPIRSRVLARYGLVSWHPLKQVDVALNQKLSDLYDQWRQSRQEELAKGTGPDTITTDQAQLQSNPDANGKTTTTSIADGSTTLSEDKVKAIFSSIQSSRSLKVTGGLATAIGLVCVARTVDVNYGLIKYVQVVEPLTRMGWDAIVVGNQIMSGQDVNPAVMSFLAKSFNQLDAEGNIISNWSDAQSIKTEEGQTGGVNVDGANSSSSARDLIAQGAPSWLAWTNSGAVSALCGTLGSLVTGIVSFGVGLVTDGIVTTAGYAVATTIGGPIIIDKLSHLLSGNAVNVLASGAEWGNDINYGSKLAGNSMALPMGGVPLTSGQTAQLDIAENAKVQQEFASQSLVHKLFSPTDPKSAVAKLFDNTSPSLTRNLNHVASIFTHVGSLFSALPSLFTPKASAAMQPYDYGFPEYGFSQADLNNPLVADPYANSDAAAQILDDQTNGSKYIQKAMDCFGVNIVKTTDDDGNQRWDVIPGDGSAGPFNAKTSPYGDNYPPDCARPSGLDPTSWLRIRFFIFDTGTMEGYACFNNDQTSCSNDGFDQSSTSFTGSKLSFAGSPLL